VRRAFGTECEIREFRWSGENTHQARLDAGAQLARAIEKEDRTRRVHIIGHSHGGNVALVAANHLSARKIESVVVLANPNIALLGSGGQPPEWLYWGMASERVARIWNLYSPEDFVQTTLAQWFHGVPTKGREVVHTRQQYPATAQKSVRNAEIRWNRRLAAHRNMHSEVMGLCVGALLKGKSIDEAMDAARLSVTGKNDVRDRGGWPGVRQTFELLQTLSDPRPFDLGSTTSRVGVLFVHGFTASPAEMRPMAETVWRATGWKCKAILLPGHGTQVGDMQTARGEDWVLAVERAYDALSKECDHVFLAGLSLGAVLCCHVALRRVNDRKLRGLLLLAPAFGVRRSRAIGIQLLRPIYNLASKGKRASDYFLDNRLYTYLRLPMNLAAQVMQLGATAANSMDKLRNLPVMIFAGDRESTVSLSRILSVANDNPWIRLVRLARSRHILTVEPDNQILFETSIRFMEECLGRFDDVSLPH
jgi:carboxylesterase